MAVYRGERVKLQPVAVESQLRESSELPFLDKELSSIKGSFVKNG